MKNIYQKHHKGSSLVFVIIAVAFVGILASILLNVTLINIETKGTDREVKKLFYTAEEVMDKLHITLENISEKAMKEAYVDLLKNYTGDVMNTTDQAKIQTNFAETYINKILDEITPGTPQGPSKLSVDPSNTDKRQLIGATYNVGYIKTQINDAFTTNESLELSIDEYIATEQDDAELEVVFDGSKVDTEKYLLLKNMKVKYYKNADAANENSEVSAWITTDIKLSVPILLFEGGGTYPNFTEYAIIGDYGVDSQGANASIDGSLYAGYKGFNVGTISTVTVKRKSANIITRQDVSVEQGSTLTLGEKEDLVNVYAKNYRTKKLDSSSSLNATLNIYANSYIMDDLSLDAPYSDVYLGGTDAVYYGYSFNKDNTADTATVLDAEYSSAILINGKHSSLYMDVSKALLAGRGYITKLQNAATGGIPKNGVLMGESIAIKSDQNFYLVSDEYMKERADGSRYSNPMSWAEYDSLPGDPGKKEVLSDEFRSSKIGKLLKSGTGQGVVPYVYDITGTNGNAAMVYFYYNFKSQDAADTFFSKYCDKDEVKNRIVSNEYLNFGGGSISGMGLTLSGNLTLFASGNYMEFPDSDNYTLHGKTIDTGDEALFKKQSIDYATTFKSLCMDLTTKKKNTYNSVYDGDDGFGMTEEQLEGNQIFDSIMTIVQGSSEHKFVTECRSGTAGFVDAGIGSGNVKVKAVPVEVDGATVWAVFVVSSDTDPESASPVPLGTLLNSITYTKEDGTVLEYKYQPSSERVVIVVANCNISADCELRGTVISDNKVFIKNNMTITAEPALLRSMFRKQRAIEGSKSDPKDKFITYFLEFAGFTAGEGSSNADSVVDISRYITYSNWKKNND